MSVNTQMNGDDIPSLMDGEVLEQELMCDDIVADMHGSPVAVPSVDTETAVDAQTPTKLGKRVRRAAAQAPIIELSPEDQARMQVYNDSIQSALRGGISEIIYGAKQGNYEEESTEPESPLFFTSVNERMLSQTVLLRTNIETLRKLLEFRKTVNSVEEALPISAHSLIQRLCHESTVPLPILAMQQFYILYSCPWGDLVIGCNAETEDIAAELDFQQTISTDMPQPSTLVAMETLISSLMARVSYGVPGGFQIDKVTFQSPSKKRDVDVRSGDSYAFYMWEMLGNELLSNEKSVFTSLKKIRKEFSACLKYKVQYIEYTMKGNEDMLEEIEKKIIKSMQELTVSVGKYKSVIEKLEKVKESELKKREKEEEKRKKELEKQEKLKEKEEKERLKQQEKDKKKEDEANKKDNLPKKESAPKKEEKKAVMPGFMAKFLVKKDVDTDLETTPKTVNPFTSPILTVVEQPVNKVEKLKFREYRMMEHSYQKPTKVCSPLLQSGALTENITLQEVLAEKFASRLARRMKKKAILEKRKIALDEMQKSYTQPIVKQAIVEAPAQLALLLECKEGITTIVDSSNNITIKEEHMSVASSTHSDHNHTNHITASKRTKILQFTEETRPNWCGPWPKGLGGFPLASASTTDPTQVIVNIRPRAPLCRYNHINYSHDSELDWEMGSGDDNNDEDEEDGSDDSEEKEVETNDWVDQTSDLAKTLLSNDEKPGIATYKSVDPSLVIQHVPLNSDGKILKSVFLETSRALRIAPSVGDVHIILHALQAPICVIEPTEQKKRKFRRPTIRKAGKILTEVNELGSMNTMTDDISILDTDISTSNNISNNNTNNTNNTNNNTNNTNNTTNDNMITLDESIITPSPPIVVQLVPVRRKIQPQAVTSGGTPAPVVPTDTATQPPQQP